MESERKIIISFLFKRSGKDSLKYSDLYLALSMDLNWFTPEDAKTFINFALKENLLIRKEDIIKPNFDYEKTNIPLGFAPSERVFETKKVDKQEEKEESILDRMIKIFFEKTNIDREQITKIINSIAKEKNITEEVAALLVGKQHNINFEDFYNEIEEEIFENN